MYKELIVDDIEELVATVMSDVENIDIAYRIIAKYEEASAIIKELLQYEETSAYHLEIWSEDWNDYNKEFLITVDSTLAILCEPLYQDGDYLSYDSDKVFIMDGCSQKSVADCEDGVVTVVMYSDSVDECNECCGECKCGCKEEVAIESDGDMHGFSVNRSDENSYSSYSFFSTDMELVEQMVRLFR